MAARTCRGDQPWRENHRAGTQLISARPGSCCWLSLCWQKSGGLREAAGAADGVIHLAVSQLTGQE
jgi:hypothetical protein